MTIPINDFSLRLFDVDSVAKWGFSGEKLASLLMEDAAMDAFSDFCIISSPTPAAYLAVKIWECSLLKSFPDDPPLVRRPIPEGVNFVLVPCALRNGHWSLLVHNVSENTTTLMDPLYDPNVDMMQHAQNIVRGLKKIYGLVEAPREIVVRNDCKFQERGTNNCGAHVCLFMEQLCFGRAIEPFGDMSEYRFKIRKNILSHVGCAEKDESKVAVKKATTGKNRKRRRPEMNVAEQNIKRMKQVVKAPPKPWWWPW
jgi:hypothetical protein